MDKSQPSINASKNQLLLLVNEAIYQGAVLDKRIDKYGNTLLHLCVQHDLQDCVIKLLSAGADTNERNYDGFSSIDLALEDGNQILLQLLNRREEYRHQVTRANNTNNNNNDNDNMMMQSPLESTTDLLSLGAVYEDYLDWSDSRRAQHVKDLIDSLTADEKRQQMKSEALEARKEQSLFILSKLIKILLKKEINYLIRLWDNHQFVKSSQTVVNVISGDLEKLKAILTVSHETIYWKGDIFLRKYKGFILERWKEGRLFITGSNLVIKLSPSHPSSMSSPATILIPAGGGGGGAGSLEDMNSSSSPYGSYQNTNDAEEYMLSNHMNSTIGGSSSSPAAHHQRSTARSSYASKDGRSERFLSWSDGPLRRNFRRSSSTSAGPSLPGGGGGDLGSATSSSSTNTTSKDGSKIITIDMQRIVQLQIIKNLKENQLEHEVVFQYVDSSYDVASTATTGGNAAATPTRAGSAGTATVGGGNEGVFSRQGSVDKSPLMANKTSSSNNSGNNSGSGGGGIGAALAAAQITGSTPPPPSASSQPQPSSSLQGSRKVHTLYLRLATPAPSKGHNANASLAYRQTADYLAYVVKSIVEHVDVQCSLNGRPVGFRYKGYDSKSSYDPAAGMMMAGGGRGGGGGGAGPMDAMAAAGTGDFSGYSLKQRSVTYDYYAASSTIPSSSSSLLLAAAASTRVGAGDIIISAAGNNHETARNSISSSSYNTNSYYQINSSQQTSTMLSCSYDRASFRHRHHPSGMGSNTATLGSSGYYMQRYVQQQQQQPKQQQQSMSISNSSNSTSILTSVGHYSGYNKATAALAGIQEEEATTSLRQHSNSGNGSGNGAGAGTGTSSLIASLMNMNISPIKLSTVLLDEEKDSTNPTEAVATSTSWSAAAAAEEEEEDELAAALIKEQHHLLHHLPVQQQQQQQQQQMVGCTSRSPADSSRPTSRRFAPIMTTAATYEDSMVMMHRDTIATEDDDRMSNNFFFSSARNSHSQQQLPLPEDQATDTIFIVAASTVTFPPSAMTRHSMSSAKVMMATTNHQPDHHPSNDDRGRSSITSKSLRFLPSQAQPQTVATTRIEVEDSIHYTSPKLEMSMVKNIDYIPILKGLSEKMKRIRDQVKRKLEEAVVVRAELKEEYDYLQSLRMLASDPPTAPTGHLTSSLANNNYQSHHNNNTRTHSQVAAAASLEEGENGSSGSNSRSQRRANSRTKNEQMSNLLLLYRDGIDEEILQEAEDEVGQQPVHQQRELNHHQQQQQQRPTSSVRMRRSFSEAARFVQLLSEAPSWQRQQQHQPPYQPPSSSAPTVAAPASSSNTSSVMLPEYIPAGLPTVSAVTAQLNAIPPLPSADSRDFFKDGSNTNNSNNSDQKKKGGSGILRLSPWKGKRSPMVMRGGSSGRGQLEGGGRTRSMRTSTSGMELMSTTSGSNSNSSILSRALQNEVEKDNRSRIPEEEERQEGGEDEEDDEEQEDNEEEDDEDGHQQPFQRRSLFAMNEEDGVASSRSDQDPSSLMTTRPPQLQQPSQTKRRSITTSTTTFTAAAAAAAATASIVISIEEPQTWRNKIGPPPAAFRKLFEKVIYNVEEIWNCELESYETYKKRAQCLVSIQKSYQRLQALRQQDHLLQRSKHVIAAPQKEELFDIEL